MYTDLSIHLSLRSGPLIYVDGRINIALFPGGYVYIGQRLYIFRYYTQDYLGNNRAIINGTTGSIEELLAYYPFGGIIIDLISHLNTLNYAFGGKELLRANGLNEYDFRARRYYQAIPHFSAIDPMAEKYPWLSPYLFCANNPVNLIDPSRMIWENPEDAENLKKDIDGRINSYQMWIDILKNLNSDDASLAGIVSEFEERIDNLNTSKSDIDLLGEDNDHVYSFSSASADGAHYVKKGQGKNVIIETSVQALSIHEITHVRQSLEAGGLEFSSEGYLINSGSNKNGKHLEIIEKIANVEVEAYIKQYSFDPHSMPNWVTNIGSIDVNYVGSLMNRNGRPAYPIIHDYSNVLKNIMNLNSRK